MSTELLLLSLSILTLFIGHYFKMLRWRQFIEVYELSSRKVLLHALSIGYIINFFVPFRIGDLIRVYIAGKKMKNGMAFSLSTVVIDRCLDVLVVGLFFTCFYLMDFNDTIIADSFVFYIIFALIIILGMILCIKYSKYPKKIIMHISSIFNSKIELSILFFSWSFISSIKDFYKQISRKKIILNTFLMWFFYILSYYIFSQFIVFSGGNLSLIDVFSLLFSKSSFDISTVNMINDMAGLLYRFPAIIAVYIISPVVILYIVSIFVGSGSKKIIQLGNKVPMNKSQLNLLPHTKDRDKLNFLEMYFSEEGKEYLSAYLELNRDINILQDFSAGSNATTMLCMNEKYTFYRKYAFGKDGDKLYEQVEWLHTHKDVLNLPEIIYEKREKDYCCYDMPYDMASIGFFNYSHSVPIEDSWPVLKCVLEDLNNNLYVLNVKKCDDISLKKYINDKVIKNLNKLKNSKEIKLLMDYDTIIINGREYKNLNYFLNYLSMDYLYEVFKNDEYSNIHGDLTIENIIFCQNNPSLYYIIDPNTGNVHDSCNLDYAKLLQSLHGGYEFLMKTEKVSLNKNEIKYVFTKSFVYESLYKKYNKFMNESFSLEKVRSIYFHEIIHWLRLMPYKIEKNGKRAVIFYAGLITVLNDIIEMFERE